MILGECHGWTAEEWARGYARDPWKDWDDEQEDEARRENAAWDNAARDSEQGERDREADNNARWLAGEWGR